MRKKRKKEKKKRTGNKKKNKEHIYIYLFQFKPFFLIKRKSFISTISNNIINIEEV